MKHPPGLMPLSAAHDAALRLAVQIAESRDDASIVALMESVPATFAREIEPHLVEEESTLLRKLDEAGEDELVQRTLAEHRNLRDLVAQISAGDRDSLQLFWIALHALVRFEEREVFRVAEAVLPDAVLNRPLSPDK